MVEEETQTTQTTDVDMEWVWPPIQAESNKIEFAKARLAGCDVTQAYEQVLLKIAKDYMRVCHPDVTVADVEGELGRVWGSSGWWFNACFQTNQGEILFDLEYDETTKLLYDIRSG